MNIQNIKTQDIKPYLENPRQNKNAINVVKKSLQEFGFQQPLVLDKDNIVVAGHTRLEAAKQLNIKEVPCIIADNLSEERIKAYRIMDNKSAEYASWDLELLTQELNDLIKMDFDLELTGFSDDELEDLGLNYNFDEFVDEGLSDEDEVPEISEETVSREGDVWILGNHRVMCGSATNINHLEELMQKTYPDLIHTDPPYGMNAVSKSGVLSKNYDGDIMGDDNNLVAKDAFNLIYNMYPNAKQIWWGANYYSSTLPDSECWLVWDKNNGQSDQTDCELAWANFRSVVRQFTQASEKINRLHPTQKPVSLMEWIIKRFKIQSKTIADFFGGSGSTLIAAEKYKINAFIMELDPRFADVIVKRWQNFTGKDAYLESSENTFDQLEKIQKNTNDG